jgi:hypothetical protein
MKTLLTKLVMVAIMMSAVPAAVEHGGNHGGSPWAGGCDAEYWPILTYNPYETWATYGYPQFILYQNDPPRGYFWYDGTEVDDLWWYVCPPDGNLHSYEDAAWN